MSMQVSFYVGPYIKAFYHYIDKEVEYRGCPKCEKEENSGNYCKICGEVLGHCKKIQKEKSISWYDDRLEDFIDIFSTTGEIDHDGFDVLITNGESFKNREFDLDEIELQKIEGEDINKETEWFIKKYKSKIKKLEKYYDKVIVEWGIVQSYY